ncbi:hypothetical protein BgiBS90_020764, partial [Biomphalaria glabrata]
PVWGIRRGGGEERSINEIFKMWKIPSYAPGRHLYVSFSEECVDESAVISSVGITNIRVVQQGQILKYQKINANLGNGYDSNTGIFTAPR